MSSSSSSSTSKDNNSNTSKETILYQRSPDRLKLTRTAFGFTCFHSACWLWYSAYLMPMVNAAQTEIDMVAIDPMSSAAGLGFAALAQTIFIFYPMRTISKLSIVEQGSSSSTDNTNNNNAPPKLLVYGYNMPLIDTTTTPDVYSLGDLGIDPDIAYQCEGDLSQFAGHLVLQIDKNSRRSTTFGLPYFIRPEILDIRDPSNLPDPVFLMLVLLQPQQALQQWNQRRRQEKQQRQQPRGQGGSSATTDSNAEANESRLRSIVRKRK
eukprot:CAMPEP_0198144894 /NCGR_PEP_ID=MMETSP1443-20131203/19403_1 /TAXON_ID=186043 /ORGANISM="Entomoneis sp., Strain CCMP2396" /LENGTH=265 /DNA_ID=CAMNT_0043808383 /DNA_START=353 /DNA_END=1150 /DNA_ORIENTATION=-